MQEVMPAAIRILVVLFGVQVYGVSSCPHPCKCFFDDLVLRCRNSSLTEIVENIPSKVMDLDYSFNSLSELPNEIFVEKNIINLSYLKLDWNWNITLYPDSFKGLQNLKWLDLIGINIIQINPDQLKYNPIIEKFVVSQNPIQLPTQGTFLNSNSLKKLLMKWCSIPSIPEEAFSGTPNLEELDLSNNEIQALRENLFNNLKHLKILDLSYNKIKVLRVQTFQPLTKIEVIKLHNNRLMLLHNGIIDDKRNLREVTLGENPLDCTCRLYQTWWILSLNGVKLEDGKCALPSYMQNVGLDQAYHNADCSRRRVQPTPTQFNSCVFWGDDGCQ